MAEPSVRDPLQEYYEDISYPANVGEESEIIPNTLTLHYAYHSNGNVDVDVERDRRVAGLNKMLNETDLSQAVEFDGVFPSSMWLTESEKAQQISTLESELEYQILAAQYPEQFANLQDIYWESQLKAYEKENLIEALVQNDISVSYDIDVLKASIENECCDYFPANFKKVQDSKVDNKVPDFRENEIVYNPIKILPEYFRTSVEEVGRKYLDSKIASNLSLQLKAVKGPEHI